MSVSMLWRRVLSVFSALLLVALTAAVVGVGERLPDARGGETVSQVHVPAADVRLGCQAPPRIATAAVGEDIQYDEFDPAAEEVRIAVRALTVERSAGAPAAEGLLSVPGDDESVDLSGTDELRLAEVEDSVNWSTIVAAPADDLSALVTGTSVARSDTGDLRGLAVSPCAVAGVTSWLVGGHTMPGGSSQLVLLNPGQTPATVDLELWGATGLLDEASSQVVVAPGGERVVLLEALVPDEERLAIRATATGGQVTAAIVHTELMGLVPGGVSVVSASAEPATELVVPGVVLGEEGSEDADDLRVVNPGDRDATVTIDLLGAEGVRSIPGADGMVVDAGTVADLPLSGLPEGEWAVRVRSDEPVTAAMRLHRTAEEAEVVAEVGGEEIRADSPAVDTTWLPATSELLSGVVALPAGAGAVDTARLVVTNPHTESVAVRLRTFGEESAQTHDLDVPAESSAALSLDPAEIVGVELVVTGEDPGSGVHAAILFTAQTDSGTLLSGLPVTEDPHVSRSVPLAPVVPSLR